jgi:subtilisin family serine protease
MKRWVPFAVVALAVTACQDASGPSRALKVGIPTAALVKAANPIPGSYIVVMKDAVANVDGEVEQIGQQYGANATYRYKSAVKGFAGKLSAAAVAALLNDSRVAYIEEDQPVSAVTTQPGATWGLDRIDQRDLPVSTTYTYNADGTGVTAYIIDTGILLTHNEFGGRAVSGYDAVDGGSADDCNGHGTHVAGTVGGATYGVAKNVGLVAVRVLDCGGSGTTAGVIAGVDWVTGNHAAGAPAVANMSLGGGVSTTLDNAVMNSIADGVTYGVAAGNSNANACNASPARAATALTVGSTTNTDARSSFSNFGTCVDIFAPGSSITSAWYTSPTATNTISGTSMATPHVVGAAALYLQTNNAATPAQVESALEGNATLDKVTSAGTGSPNLLLYTGFISAGPPGAPTARFTFTCTGLACSFDGGSSSAQAGATYDWTWGDGTTGTGRTASHTYASAGTRTVTLLVTDAGGSSSTSHDVTVAAIASSVARFTKSCSGRTCSFNASTSSNATSYAWNFGDGATASGVTTSHRFARNRSYTVTLTTLPGSSKATLPVTCTSSCR